MSPKRRGRRRALGQHYLIDPLVTAEMVRLAQIEHDDRVLEIGTGRGVLTRELRGLSDHFEAFELDEDNYLATKELGLGGVELYLGDAFAETRKFDILVSSLPYSESSNFVEWLSKHRYNRAVVLLQRDFAGKLLAQPGGKHYRAISVISQISSDVRLGRVVGRESFEPPPKVSSALVVMEFRNALSPEDIGLVKMLFSQRRRKLSAALRELGLKASGLGAEQLSRRVQDLSLSDFGEVLKRIEKSV